MVDNDFSVTRCRIPYLANSSTAWRPGYVLLLLFPILLCPSRSNAQENLQKGDYAITARPIEKQIGVVREGSAVKIIERVGREERDEPGPGYVFWARRISSPKIGDDLEHEVVEMSAPSSKIKPVPEGWGDKDIGRLWEEFVILEEATNIDGERYWKNTIFEIDKMEDGKQWIVVKNGELVKIELSDGPKEEGVNARKIEIAWNSSKKKLTENIPTEYNDTYTLGRLFYKSSVIAWIFIILSIFYLKVSSEGSEWLRDKGFWVFTIPIFILTYFIYKGGEADFRMQEAFQTMFWLHLTPEGNILPMDQTKTNASNMVGYTLADFIWVIYYPLWYSYIGFFIYLFPSFVRGAHYLSLPYPTDEHLVHDDSELPPDVDENGFAKYLQKEAWEIDPAWIARNKARKARANKEKVSALESLAKEVRKYKITRNLYSDDESDDT